MAVIGWIQFGLLTLTIGLPLLLIVIFLLVPMRYDFKGVLIEGKEFPEEEGEDDEASDAPGKMIEKMVTQFLMKITDPIQGNGKFTWLAGLVKGEMHYQHRELSWKARVFGKKLSGEKTSAKTEESAGVAQSANAGLKESAGVDQSTSAVESESANIDQSTNAVKDKSAGVAQGTSVGLKESTDIDLFPEVKRSEGEGDPLGGASSGKVEGASLEGRTERKSHVSLEHRDEKSVSASLESKAEKSVSANLESKAEKKSSSLTERKEEKRASKAQAQRAEDEHKEQEMHQEDSEHQEEDRSIPEKMGDFFEKMEEGYDNIHEKIEYTYEQICDKIDLVSEGKEKISDFITHETHQGAYRKFTKELKRLWTAVKPGKIKGHLKVGFEDPRTTGLFVAGASFIVPYTGGNAKLEADFDNKVLEGDLRIKGKLRAGSLAWFVTKVVANKDVRTTVVDIRKLVQSFKKAE